MCGILAYLGATALPVDHPAIRSVAHRGPDDEGAEHFPVGEQTLTLGHRRLSILDLSPAGRQPMSYGDGRFWIVYNGEVYNYLELRRDLEAAGHRFRSATDTEVLLAAYERWGEACLERFNGMFALVLFDARDRKLFLARDRFGIKPLYIWNSPRGLAVASEIKQFTALPGFAARLDPQMAYELLAHDDIDHTAATLFSGVEQLRGGERATLDLGQWRPGQVIPRRRWYDPAAAARARRGDPRRDAAEFGELLADAVRLRLRADVPVGFCLSGGLDSSTVVGLADRRRRELGQGDLNTFSACFDDPDFDERPFIEAVCGRVQVRRHDVFPTAGDFLDRLDRIVSHMELPLSTASVYAQWRVFEAARRAAVPVTLDGQGADEILAGYHSFFGSYLFSLLLRLRLVSLTREAGAIRRRHGYRARAEAKMILMCLLPMHWRLRPVWPREVRRVHRNLDGDWLRSMGVKVRGPHPMRRQSSVRAMSLARIAGTLPALLHNADRMSMTHAVEVRLPYLDYRVVELALALGDRLKIADGWTKEVLRKIGTGLLPETVARRTDKMTFQPPEADWVRRQAPDRFRERLREAAASPPWDRRSLIADFEDFMADRGPYRRVFMKAVTLAEWRRLFNAAA